MDYGIDRYLGITANRRRSSLGITAYVPKSITSGSKAEGRFRKADFVHVPNAMSIDVLPGIASSGSTVSDANLRCTISSVHRTTAEACQSHL